MLLFTILNSCAIIGTKMEFKIFPAFFDRPANIYFTDQEPDEHIELFLRQHWVTNIGWLVLSLLGTIVPLFVVDISHNFQFRLVAEVPFHLRLAFFILWYLGILAFVIENFLYWYFNIYIVTDKHLIDFDFNSVLNKVVKESRLDDVQSVSSQINGIAKPLFNFGDVTIQTAAKNEEIKFVSVPKPELVADRIEELQNAIEPGPDLK